GPSGISDDGDELGLGGGATDRRGGAALVAGPVGPRPPVLHAHPGDSTGAPAAARGPRAPHRSHPGRPELAGVPAPPAGRRRPRPCGVPPGATRSPEGGYVAPWSSSGTAAAGSAATSRTVVGAAGPAWGAWACPSARR